ncbi:MAG: hypothetical protein KF819_18500 [Labilithrix sp.]|nr:hypothetical protein [Labilithrix sp.]
MNRIASLLLIEETPREMTNGFLGASLDLRFHFGRSRRVVDEDAELTVFREEPAGRAAAVLLERHRLDGEVEDLATDDDANETDQAARDVGGVLGSVLHVAQAKDDSTTRKPHNLPATS